MKRTQKSYSQWMMRLYTVIYLIIGSTSAMAHSPCWQDTVKVKPDSLGFVSVNDLLGIQDSSLVNTIESFHDTSMLNDSLAEQDSSAMDSTLTDQTRSAVGIFPTGQDSSAMDTTLTDQTRSAVDTVAIIPKTPEPPIPQITIFPMGEVSFADSVKEYDPGALGRGTGDEPDQQFQNPYMAMGPPDFENFVGSDTGFVSLGRGGFIVMKFLDNVLIDGPGPDLHIAEVRDPAEDVIVWISEDGRIFLPIGRATSESPNLDISTVARRGSVYPYVKVRDDPFQGGETGTASGGAVGADIDAIGAINTAMRIIIPVDQIFRNRSIRFREGATNRLNEVVDEIRQFDDAIVFIEVHTDGNGTEDFNMMLSQSQAGEIRNYFLDEAGLTSVTLSALGIGEARPVASNDTDAGRYANRRIEFYIQIDQR